MQNSDTVVAFGTSTPELVITVISASSGNGGLAIGNVVGSNIFNILAIIGLTALVYPIKVERTVMTREIPMVVISSLVLLVMGNQQLLDGSSQSVITRVNGLVLVLMFGIFMWYTFAAAKQAPLPDPAIDKTAAGGRMSMLKAIIWVAGGLAMLVYGGSLFVDSASALAGSLGVSDTIIGLTIAAAGTSLPELATSLVAATKGKTDMAIGNVIGSNIFNILMVLGVGATVRPIPFGGVGNLDLLVLMGASVLFLAFGWLFGNRTFTRAEGALMSLCYVSYVVYLCVTA